MPIPKSTESAPKTICPPLKGPNVFFYFSNKTDVVDTCLFVCLFDLKFYVPSTIFQLNRDETS